MLVRVGTVEKRELKPVLKWAGGKTKLLPFLKDNLPDSYRTYYEPFIGGASLLFSIQPKLAVINDINLQLINLYKTIKDNADDFISLIQEYDSVNCTKEFYLELRNRYNNKIENNSMDTECAALMVWINKHCFNGLYRVNNKGLFNVPYNNKVKGNSCNIDNIKSICSYFNSVELKICNMDFEEVCKSVKEGDFVYFDSPYIPESATANFTSYAKDGFSLEDHKRLASLFRHLDSIGAKLLLSNNDVPLIYDLYSGFNIIPIEAKRMINRDASKRTGKEVIVKNY